MRIIAALLLLLTICVATFAQAPQSDLKQFVRVDSNVLALTHVRIVDGTGAPPMEDQTILIVDGRITEIHASKDFQVKEGIKSLDLNGYTVLPGLVGMHDHMFFPMGGAPPMYSNMGISFPRLYLALGVTTIRTTGSVQPY